MIDLNPLNWLGDKAKEGLADGFTSMMMSIWSGALWLLKTAFGLIDNFTPDEMRRAVEVRNELNPAVRLEASGGLTLESARLVAETGVDYIAVGELTHSARVLDIGLDLDTV